MLTYVIYQAKVVFSDVWCGVVCRTQKLSIRACCIPVLGTSSRTDLQTQLHSRVALCNQHACCSPHIVVQLSNLHTSCLFRFDEDMLLALYNIGGEFGASDGGI